MTSSAITGNTAQQKASNIFNADGITPFYAEGTFTPIAKFGGSAGGTIVARTGRYIRVGNLVTINIYLALSAFGTGQFEIGDLPFTALNVANVYQSFNVGMCIKIGRSGYQVKCQISPNTSTISFYLAAEGSGATVSLVDTDMAATSEVVITGSYFI